jgi:hypothetical protein
MFTTYHVAFVHRTRPYNGAVYLRDTLYVFLFIYIRWLRVFF